MRFDATLPPAARFTSKASAELDFYSYIYAVGMESPRATPFTNLYGCLAAFERGSCFSNICHDVQGGIVIARRRLFETVT